ncbi:GNAT family N-acetyltransferase [Haladaptatus caseinilyticus]|uniref:GNAT family N-acetyltransferase n=1 Tax=Haladaptatus caseinilyticus TaxID=2993314 RepID=UPI00224B26EB|nr:GNAT family N-acetyltransferase [Haladaptatus caseinilyticus]
MADRTYEASTTDSYRIRQYEPDDRAGVLALYETVFGDRRGRGDWFDWKFGANPYRSRVPICIAERDGQVVGARPSLPIPLCVGGARELALVQVDPMVHPDHRRRGLFTRMAQGVYDYYGPREPSIVVGFPNEAVKAGLEKMAKTLSLRDGIMSKFVEFYRVQNPRALADSPLSSVAVPGVRGYLATRDLMASTASDSRTDRYTGVPVSVLAEIATRHRTERVHAVRDEEFLGWRFANPRYDYTTYVFSGEDGPVAIVVGEQRNTDANIVHLSDVLPVVGGWSRAKALSALLGRILADYRDADVVVAAGTTIPRSVLARHGFFGTDRFPLSRLTSAYWFSARPLVPSGQQTDPRKPWVVNGQPLADENRWNLSFCELEVG